MFVAVPFQKSELERIFRPTANGYLHLVLDRRPQTGETEVGVADLMGGHALGGRQMFSERGVRTGTRR
jgi:hypothetical protein